MNLTRYKEGTYNGFDGKSNRENGKFTDSHEVLN
jgi:hypothetical protein